MIQPPKGRTQGFRYGIVAAVCSDDRGLSTAVWKFMRGGDAYSQAAPSPPHGAAGQVRPGASGPAARAGDQVVRVHLGALGALGVKDDHLGAAGTVDLVGIAAPTTQAAVGRPIEPVAVQAARGPTGRKQQLGSGLGSLAKAKLARPVQLPAPYYCRSVVPFGAGADSLLTRQPGRITLV